MAPSRRSRRPPSRLGPDQIRVLTAIESGRVYRDTCDGQRVGMWAIYMLDEQEVGMWVRNLARLELVEVPLLGPPRITADGRARLRSQGTASE